MQQQFFPVDVLVEPNNICNLIEEADRLRQHILQGHHVVLFGRRNTGKSSLVRNILIREMRKMYRANERFSAFGIKIDGDVMNHLINRMGNIPEAINITCLTITQMEAIRNVTRSDVDQAIHKTVELRASRYQETLANIRGTDQKILIAIAKCGGVSHPKSKDFLNKVSSLSPTGVFTSFKRLERNADIYKENDHYAVADPLLAEFLKLMY